MQLLTILFLNEKVLPEYQAQVSQQETMQKNSAISQMFSCHDVIETSYHFLAEKIHLHLSDDPGRKYET